jgi:hypothetical protein
MIAGVTRIAEPHYLPYLRHTKAPVAHPDRGLR